MNSASKVAKIISNRDRAMQKYKLLHSGTRPFTIEQIRDRFYRAFKYHGESYNETLKHYLNHILPVVISLYVEGKSIKQIEHILGMKDRTLENWIRRHQYIMEVLREARANRKDKEAEEDLSQYL